MFWAYVLNIPLAFAILIVFVFTMTDIPKATDEAFPLIWTFQNCLSTAGAQALTASTYTTTQRGSQAMSLTKPS